MLMSSFIFLVTVICYIHVFSIPHSKRFQQVKSHFLGTFFYNTVVILVLTVVYFLKKKWPFPIFQKKRYNKARKSIKERTVHADISTDE